MSSEILRRRVKVTNPQGFHMRPITAFVQLAGRFQSRVTVFKEDQDEGRNGKSLMDLLLLAAEPGTELVLEATGPDAQVALEQLADLVANLTFEETRQ